MKNKKHTRKAVILIALLKGEPISNYLDKCKGGYWCLFKWKYLASALVEAEFETEEIKLLIKEREEDVLTYLDFLGRNHWFRYGKMFSTHHLPILENRKWVNRNHLLKSTLQYDGYFQFVGDEEIANIQEFFEEE